MKLINNPVCEADLDHMLCQLAPQEKTKLSGSRILVTGCAGFLGFYTMAFFNKFREQLSLQKIVGIDNFRLGQPDWLKAVQNPVTEFLHMDVTQLSSTNLAYFLDVDYVIHMASIASPTYYRRYPLETVDANVWGLRRLLDLYKTSDKLKGFLFFSSSEVYGDPEPACIPITEDYRGNVQMLGPRACYDEAKRFGETLCYIYAEKFSLPISIVRPFNNYGPGMKIDDRRVPADFAKSVLLGQPLRIFSDGTPTRTYCYVADSIAGYLKALVYDKFDVFNIGMDKPEISVAQLAAIYQEVAQEVFGRRVEIEYSLSEDKEYLTHNPQRRCPDITRARTLLGFSPSVDVNNGVRRFLRFYQGEGANK